MNGDKSNGGSVNGGVAKGPDEAKIKAILERTGYALDVTTGQRKYGGPPPNWQGDPPGNGCEVSLGDYISEKDNCLRVHFDF